MSHYLQVLRNVPRTELLVDGWSKSRMARDFGFVKFHDAYGSIFGGWNKGYGIGSIGEDLWQEPNTGVVMLRPKPLHPKYWESSHVEYYKTGMLALGGFRVGDGQTFLEQPTNNAMMPKRNFTLIELLVRVALLAILGQANTPQLGWIMETNDHLEINEGFSFWLHIPGIYTDKASDYMMVAFGGKYVLHLQMDGIANLWVLKNVSDTESTNQSDYYWEKKDSWRFAHAGTLHGHNIQITVIPWGRHYLSFLSSISAGSYGDPVSKKDSFCHLYSIWDKEQRDTEFDTILQQFVKTKASPLTIALRKDAFQYAFAVAKVEYPTSATFTIGPESMPGGQGVPNTIVRGYDNYRLPKITYTLKNESGDAFEEGDTMVFTEVTLQANNGISLSRNAYTPEVWDIDWFIDPETFTPSWTPVDISSQWQLAKFSRSADFTVNRAELKLKRDSEFSTMFSGWGPLQIKFNGTVVWDGYFDERKPTVEGPRAYVTDQAIAYDMMSRLKKKMKSFRFLDGLGILDTIKTLIRYAGFTESDIVVIDPDGYLASISMESWVQVGDRKELAADTTIEDAIKQFIDYGFNVPLRVRFSDGKWYIYLAPTYEFNPLSPDASQLPSKRMYILPTSMEPDFGIYHPISGAYQRQMTEEERKASGNFLILGNIEFCVQEPAFNDLVIQSSTGPEDSPETELNECTVPMFLVDPRSVSDPSYWGFMGRLKSEKVSPPEIPHAETQYYLQKFARIYWDRNRKPKITLECLGEWDETVDCDDFVWVIGLDNYGNRVSYGAYRIDAFDVDTKLDLDSGTKWAARASYTLVYVGQAFDIRTPMFTTLLPS